MPRVDHDNAGRSSDKSGPPSKTRSCVTCYTRKVRCNKESPCSNCRRAGVPCIFPSTERPVRWARRYERAGTGSASKHAESEIADAATPQVLKRLKGLESLVKDLRGQLERANVAAGSSTGSSPNESSPRGSANDGGTNREAGVSGSDAGNLSDKFGRMVVKDARGGRYVSSGFWSRIYDELDGLENDSRGLLPDRSSDSEDDELPATSLTNDEIDRTPWNRNAFLFKQNLNMTGPDLRELHPLPSQIPYLLDIFQENVNSISGLIHCPTVAKMLRDSQKTGLSPSDESLAFSIYYAVVVSMEEEDVLSNFGVPKIDLSLKYRMGLENALAKADFLNAPDLTLVQALTIFISLARRHDSPRFVWMMTGIVIRMAQAIGLQRDGSRFEHMTPFEVEMRRRVWWVLYTMDIRSSEDQGMEYTIVNGSFDTKFPLNINDTDISPDTKTSPKARDGLTDMTYPLVWLEMSEATKQMMNKSTSGALDMAEQDHMMDEAYQKLNGGLLRYMDESSDAVYRIGVVIARIVMAKMTLLIHMPILFSETDQRLTAELRNRLFVAGLEIAEYNHELNEEPAGRRWRWVYQVYSHFWAIIFILLEVSRRPWSPLVERAWLALHSPWLIPAQSKADKTSQIWVPLRKLLAKARKHRDSELGRLRSDAEAASLLLKSDETLPCPSSPGLFTGVFDVTEVYRERWRRVLGISTQARSVQEPEPMTAPTPTATNTPSTQGLQGYPLQGDVYAHGPMPHDLDLLYNTMPMETGSENIIQYPVWQESGIVDPSSTAWPIDPSFPAWLWQNEDPSLGAANLNFAAADTNMDLDVDWYDWIKSTGGMG
ncbi:hypothetical protein EJ05DRAFT_242344 [Pseudovirgaria hyperparasitica]|uniref:Zn(2)-C6 fungal-type domain-containing protein n=1 Tax=Pseudovirgaria hyperparasitica TaxID=470096 RepID=A0A6A6WGL2_9PEZI|nr:uncharacterized protein EJ05DRAFT_242344 [Pseudovirgaria hyperparasitica]KAF2760777.1 hypothetical protein EJ05DRAFT_242344 [Pseudovirgaria hyperparasitica]